MRAYFFMLKNCKVTRLRIIHIMVKEGDEKNEYT